MGMAVYIEIYVKILKQRLWCSIIGIILSKTDNLLFFANEIRVMLVLFFNYCNYTFIMQRSLMKNNCIKSVDSGLLLMNLP